MDFYYLIRKFHPSILRFRKSLPQVFSFHKVYVITAIKKIIHNFRDLQIISDFDNYCLRNFLTLLSQILTCITFTAYAIRFKTHFKILFFLNTLKDVAVLILTSNIFMKLRQTRQH